MNQKGTDLEQPLMPKKRNPLQIFDLSKDELSALFEPDSIREGHSYEQIKKWGGVDGLMNKLQTSEKKGLDSKDKGDIAARETEYGRNDPIIRPQATILELVRCRVNSLTEQITEQFEDRMLQLLTGASIVSLIIGVIQDGWAEGWLEGFAIFIAVFLIVSVTATNNYMREKQFQKLNSKREQRNVMVIRNEDTVEISVFDLVVGDILKIPTGETLPVDGIVLKSNNMNIDESSVTGESDLIRKQQYSPDGQVNCFLISGSMVVEGTGLMLVLAVGVNSRNGKLKQDLQEKEELTPLQLKLEGVVDQIGNIGQWCAILTFSGMTLHLLWIKFSAGEPIFSLSFLAHLTDFFIIGVAIVVVAIPEGLPLAVTISLAYSVGKMKEENNLVRHLSACETMGGANNICTDKTGTLTENKMSVEYLYIQESTHNPIDPNNVDSKIKELFSEAISLNSDAWPRKEGGRWVQLGNKTECALLELASKFGYDYVKIRRTEPLKIIPFSSERKRMSSIVKKDDCYRVYVKGATEVILQEHATHIIDKTGKPRTLTNSESIMSDVVLGFAKKGLRTIAIAYKDIKIDSNRSIDTLTDIEIEEKLTLICIAGIRDPLRSDVPDAVRKCREAHITVRMVTGDIKETAINIALSAGILTPGYDKPMTPGMTPQDFDSRDNPYTVMEGKEFRTLVGGLVEEKDDKGNVTSKTVRNIEKFKEIAKNLRVLARSSPEDKYLLVTGLKQLDNVVAVTGDGTNDAPALKKADVGFAMGIQGTEVAKEAAGIIILDDNFKCLITAVKWGRNIFDCIRKFLQFQLTVNVVAMFMVFVGGVIYAESPFTPIQMLWVNLIMDTFASLALATEPPHEELLRRKPYGKYESLITPIMWRNILAQSLYQILWLLIILFWGDSIFGVPKRGAEDVWTVQNGVQYTILFNAFVFMQVFNEINARKLKNEEKNVFEGFFNNPMFIIIEIVTIIVQILIVQIGGAALKTSPLSMAQHFYCILIGSGSLVIGLWIKNVPDSLFENIQMLKGDQIKSEADLANTKQASLRRVGSMRSQNSLRRQGSNKEETTIKSKK